MSYGLGISVLQSVICCPLRRTHGLNRDALQRRFAARCYTVPCDPAGAFAFYQQTALQYLAEFVGLIADAATLGQSPTRCAARMLLLAQTLLPECKEGPADSPRIAMRR
jgi:hypothetical protein